MLVCSDNGLVMSLPLWLWRATGPRKGGGGFAAHLIYYGIVSNWKRRHCDPYIFVHVLYSPMLSKYFILDLCLDINTMGIPRLGSVKDPVFPLNELQPCLPGMKVLERQSVWRAASCDQGPTQTRWMQLDNWDVKLMAGWAGGGGLCVTWLLVWSHDTCSANTSLSVLHSPDSSACFTERLGVAPRCPRMKTFPPPETQRTPPLPPDSDPLFPSVLSEHLTFPLRVQLVFSSSSRPPPLQSQESCPFILTVPVFPKQRPSCHL